MSPVLRHHPRGRDAALQRRGRLIAGATAGGLGAVGVITGMLAVSAASNGASSGSAPAGSGSSSSAQDTQPSSGAAQDPTSGGSLAPPVTAPTQPQLGGGGPHAVSGGSGR